MCDTGYYGYENVNTMVHAAIGYLTADLARSKTPISTALANGVNAYAVEAIKKDKNLKAYFDDNPALLRLVSIGIGAGIGGLTGDGNADAWSGASSAQNATRWNALNMTREQYFKGMQEAMEAAGDDQILKEAAKAKYEREMAEESESNKKEAREYEKTEKGWLDVFKSSSNNLNVTDNGIVFGGYNPLSDTYERVYTENFKMYDTALRDEAQRSFALNMMVTGMSMGSSTFGYLANGAMAGSEWYEGLANGDGYQLKNGIIDTGNIFADYFGKLAFGNIRNLIFQPIKYITDNFKGEIKKPDNATPQKENKKKEGNKK